MPEHEGLAEGGDGDGLVDARADVTDTELQGGVDAMGTHVPPDLAGVGDAAGVCESADEPLIGGAVGEDVGNAAAGEVLEDDGAIALEPGGLALPEGAAGAEGQEVRQHVAEDIHGVDGEVGVL